MAGSLFRLVLCCPDVSEYGSLTSQPTVRGVADCLRTGFYTRKDVCSSRSCIGGKRFVRTPPKIGVLGPHVYSSGWG